MIIATETERLPASSVRLDEPVPTYSMSERNRRWQLAYDLMDREGVEALIVYGDREGAAPAPFAPDVYFTNDRPGAVVIFSRDGQPFSLTALPMAVTDQMQARARGEDVWISPENMIAGKNAEAIVRVLKNLGLTKATIGVIGLEPYPPYYFDGTIPYSMWNTVLKALPDAVFKPVQNAFIRLSATRSAEELEVIKWSAKVGERMCEAMRDATRPGVSEADVYAAAMEVCPGHVGFSGMLLLGSGPEYFAWGPPSWTYRPRASRKIREGDVVLAEVSCSYGMLETQHQPSIAVGSVHPDFEKAAKLARESYEIGLETLRPGTRFADVVEAMERPIRRAGGWHVHPWIHSMNPFGLISGMQNFAAVLPDADRYGNARPIPLVGRAVELRPGMTFALEPNCALGKRVVNLGGTVVVGDDEPLELDRVSTRLMRV